LPDPFFCLNSDNIWLEGPRNVFRDLSDAWDPARMDAVLALVPHLAAHNFRGEGDFGMDANGRLVRRRRGRVAPFIFSGIQLVSHRLFREAPAGPFSTNVLWDRAIEERRLFGVAFTGQWFEVGTPTTSHEFMLFAPAVRREQRERIPAIVHQDGTARVQLVSRKSNPRFHELISCFHDETGVPVVINTSFNDSEPIVCTPMDAIVTFRKSGIDALVMDDVILTAKG